MFTVANYDYECTRKCKCTEHGRQITASLTKRAIPDDKLAAYVAKVCRNFAEITDELGRTSLHMSCSVDRYTIVEWLLNQGSLINNKDKESGSGPMHRAIYYGCIDCAVLLLRYGASLDLMDDDTCSPLQYVCKMCDLDSAKKAAISNELLVWGMNKNYNLGIGNDQGSTSPQFVEFFRKENICVETLAISTYHSLFLDKKGILYTVGHGKGGRLGIRDENSLPTPQKVKVPIKNHEDRIAGVSCSRNHSLVLTRLGSVFACGINDDQQLGFKPPPEKVTAFREVATFSQGAKDLVRVIAKDQFSVAYSREEIFVWGANHGQFGMNNSISHVLLPKPVGLPEKTRVELVEANNVAIACSSYTSRYPGPASSEVLILYNYKLRKIKPPHLERVKSISLSGGDFVKSGKGSPAALKVLVLTDTNVVFIWYENTQQYLRCSFSHIRLTQIDKLLYKSNQVLILSQGDVYTGKCIQTPVAEIFENNGSAWSCHHSAPRKDICVDHKIKIELSRVPNVDRAVDIFCDDNFNSFAVLQENSKKYFHPPQLMPEEYSFKDLLNEASEFDSVHDIVFHVDNETFCAHKFIVFSRCAVLRTMAEESPTSKDVHFKDPLFSALTAKMFELILKYIYCDYYATFEDIEQIQECMGPECIGDIYDVADVFHIFVQKFELNNLAKHVQCIIGATPYEGKLPRFSRLKRTSLPELYDVVIKCADNREIQAHKCILVARLEYFNLMFTHNWSEQTTINLTTIPYEYMQPIIDFLYTSDVDSFRKQNYSESFLYNMIVICDQFFVDRLRKVCEILVLERISIRRCGEMLDFACSYNCNTLKRGCLDFICQNLSRILCQRSLECCEPEILNLINAAYRQMFKNVFDYRMITPDSEAVEDEVLLSFVQDFKVDLSHKIDEDPSKTKVKVKTKEAKSKLRQYEQEAISSMRELSLKNSQNEDNRRKSESQKDMDEVQPEAHSWMKVVDKKEPKKKVPALVAPKINEILSEERKPEDCFVPLGKLSTPPKVDRRKSESLEPETPPANRSNFILGDFTPSKSGKMSQKQRKRLSSESTKTETLWSTPTKPISIPEPTNVWGAVSSPSSSSISLDTSSSFANIIRSPEASESIKSPPQSWRSKPSPSSIKKPSPAIQSISNNVSSSVHVAPGPASFSKILEDERKQKEYYDRMRTKSLVLTQIEETAITELKHFYNVENVFDEIITIERKPLPATVNFAVWQRN